VGKWGTQDLVFFTVGIIKGFEINFDTIFFVAAILTKKITEHNLPGFFFKRGWGYSNRLFTVVQRWGFGSLRGFVDGIQDRKDTKNDILRIVSKYIRSLFISMHSTYVRYSELHL
jgi:hypothetical protein